MKKLIFTLLTMLFSLPTSAYEVKKMCVTPGRQTYIVDVHFLSGEELAIRTECSNCYRYNSEYAVVFWAKNQATVIELARIDMLNNNYRTGYDQNTRIWDIYKPIYCKNDNYAMGANDETARLLRRQFSHLKSPFIGTLSPEEMREIQESNQY